MEFLKSFSTTNLQNRRRSSVQSTKQQRRISEYSDKFVDYSHFETNILNSNDIQTFIKSTYELHCQCAEQCIYKEKYMSVNTELCNRILASDDPNIKTYISKTISLFKELGLIHEINDNIYLYNNKLFTWANIKNLQNENIKKIFWMFRKGVVDNIIKIVLNNFKKDTVWKNENIFVYSVGSTTLSSDYDITVYAPADYTVKIIKAFAWHIKTKFSIDSSTLFDTNVYGKGFITFKTEDNNQDIYSEKTCANNKFYYVKENPIYQESQLMWSLLKYIKDLQEYDFESLEDDIYESIKNFLLKKFNNKNYSEFLTTAIKLHQNFTKIIPHNSFTDGTGLYINILDTESRHLSPNSAYNIGDVKEDNALLLKQTDFISLVNYFGSETYFSRGAFLDIVVNNQMCNNDTVQIKLNDYDYIQSILENAGFCITHGHTTKYFVRVKMAFEKLSNDIKEKIIITPVHILDELDNDHYISDYNNQKQDLTSDEEIKCKKYIIKFIYKILTAFFEKYYPDNTKEIYIPFKNYDVKNIIRKENTLTRNRSKTSYRRSDVPSIKLPPII